MKTRTNYPTGEAGETQNRASAVSTGHPVGRDGHASEPTPLKRKPRSMISLYQAFREAFDYSLPGL